KLVKQTEGVEIILCCFFQRRGLRFSNVDAHWNRRPSPALAQPAESFRDSIRAVVVETETVDQRSLLWKTENARLWVSPLRFGGHGPNLDETKAQGSPCGEGDTVFIQSSCKPNGIRKFYAEDSLWFRHGLKNLQRTQRKIDMRGDAQKRDCKMMRCLWIERKKQRPDESLVAILHWKMAVSAVMADILLASR